LSPWARRRGTQRNGGARSVSAAALSADGATALTIAYDRSARAWDLASGRCRGVLVPLDGEQARSHRDGSASDLGVEDVCGALWSSHLCALRAGCHGSWLVRWGTETAPWCAMGALLGCCKQLHLC